MNIAKTKIFVLVAVVLLSALLAISFAFGSPALTSSAEAYITNSFSSDISVTAYDGEGSIQTTSPSSVTLTTPSGTEIPNYTSYSFLWSNIDSFVVNLDTTSIPDATSYTYSYSVTWAPARIQDGRVSFSTDHTHQLELFTETVSSKDEIDTSFRFYVQVDDEQLWKVALLQERMFSVKPSLNTAAGDFICSPSPTKTPCNPQFLNSGQTMFTQ